ncbi:MAG TPA: hypothetical protein VKQ11_15040 [Candidatus Sulfotelmatobacter sp.]|nr:hypothetical protein [Candidatus Sulfotelmatobacter sp.]
MKSLRILSLALACLRFASVAFCQTAQQLAELTASDGQNGDELATSVAISGNVAVVGSPCAMIGSNRCQGAAYIFVKPAAGWGTTSTFVAKLTASDGAAGDAFGQAVAIGLDTVVVGAPFKTVNGEAQGEVYVFTKPATGWTSMTETARLNPSDAATTCSASEYCLFGNSVGVSGSQVVVGVPGNIVNNHANQGAVYVYVKPATGWTSTTQVAKLSVSLGKTGDQLGISVSISGDIVAAGAPNVNSKGAAYVFVRPTSGWRNASTPITTLTASDGNQYDTFGWSLGVQDHIIVVGAPQFGNPQIGSQAPGKAYLYLGSNQLAELTPSDGNAGDNFGYSVAIGGNNVLIGSILYPFDGSPNGTGKAYVFTKPASGWTSSTETGTLLPSNAMAGDYVGHSVSLTGTGNTALVGAPGHTDSGSFLYQGAAYVFVP